jgi:hypothetical protein
MTKWKKVGESRGIIGAIKKFIITFFFFQKRNPPIITLKEETVTIDNAFENTELRTSFETVKSYIIRL